MNKTVDWDKIEVNAGTAQRSFYQDPESEPAPAEMVSHPKHYSRDNALECIEEMEILFGIEEVMVFCKLNAWKYRYRAADKNGIEDLKKSDFYMKYYKQLKDKKNAI